MNITEWKVKAEHASKLAIDAKATGNAKSSAFNDLAFSALQILLMGKVQDEVALAALVSKNGPYQALRQCVSNARGLIDTFNAGPLVVTNKKDKTTHTFTKDGVMLADVPLFSVASAYKATRPDANDGPADKDFIGLALEAEGSGLTTRDILKMSQPVIDDYVSRGRAIHEQANSPLAQILAMYNKLTQEERVAFLQQTAALEEAVA